MNRLFVDMDGTLAKWQSDCPEAIYEEHYFDTLPPQQNVVDAVQILSQDPAFDVFILSAVLSPEEAPTALRDKNTWLDEHLPEIDPAHRIFCPCGARKEEYIPQGVRPDDLLLDDYSKNLHEWSGTAIKLINDVNATHGTWTGERISAANFPSEIIQKIRDVAVQPHLPHARETEEIKVIPADRTDPAVHFRGTKEEADRADAIEAERIQAWEKILGQEGFVALEFEREHDAIIVSPSARPGIIFQMTWFSKKDGQPNMDARFGGEKGSYPIESLPKHLYHATRESGARVRVLVEEPPEVRAFSKDKRVAQRSTDKGIKKKSPNISF